jgi:hypothetical protein
MTMPNSEQAATVDLGSLIEVSATAVQRALAVRGTRLPFPVVCGLILDPRWPDGLPGDQGPPPLLQPSEDGIRKLAGTAAQFHRSYVQTGVPEFRSLNRAERTTTRLQNLRTQSLINEGDFDLLQKILELIFSQNSIPRIRRDVETYHNQLLSQKPSPLAAVISAVIHESVTNGAAEFEAGRQSEAVARGVFSADSEGVVEGGGLGAIAGAEGGTVTLPGIGTVAGTVGGAVLGGLAGGAIRSLGSILDSIFD